MHQIDSSTLAAVSDTLRAWALDEQLKAHVMSMPELAAIARRVARRYVAGDTIGDALVAAAAAMERGHRVSIEYAGESVRSTELANAETDVFLRLADALVAENLPSTVSFDLSHVGSVVDPALGLANATRMAAATARLGTGLMISAEGSARTDVILDLYERLSDGHAHVGITLQARLHRTQDDLERALARPGRIRLVKGAFPEPADIAYPRDSDTQNTAFLDLARRVIQAGHPVSIATHDRTLIDAILTEHGARLEFDRVEFEMLHGIAPDLLDELHRVGHRTREYIIFGGQWWLYVLNRIAEDPFRVFDALLAMTAEHSKNDVPSRM